MVIGGPVSHLGLREMYVSSSAEPALLFPSPNSAEGLSPIQTAAVS